MNILEMSIVGELMKYGSALILNDDMQKQVARNLQVQSVTKLFLDADGNYWLVAKQRNDVKLEVAAKTMDELYINDDLSIVNA
jgi:hypothetical protein